MSDNNSDPTVSTDRANVHSLLADTLDECQPLAEFVKESEICGGLPEMRVDVRDREVIVDMYCAGDGAVVFLDYATQQADTAFTGDVEDAHRAVRRVIRHAECELTRNEFRLFAETAGDDDE